MENLFGWYYVGVCLIGYPFGRISIRLIADMVKAGNSKNPYLVLMFVTFAWPVTLGVFIWGLAT